MTIQKLFFALLFPLALCSMSIELVYAEPQSKGAPSTTLTEQEFLDKKLELVLGVVNQSQVRAKIEQEHKKVKTLALTAPQEKLESQIVFRKPLLAENLVSLFAGDKVEPLQVEFATFGNSKYLRGGFFNLRTYYGSLKAKLYHFETRYLTYINEQVEKGEEVASIERGVIGVGKIPYFTITIYSDAKTLSEMIEHPEITLVRVQKSVSAIEFKEYQSLQKRYMENQNLTTTNTVTQRLSIFANGTFLTPTSPLDPTDTTCTNMSGDMCPPDGRWVPALGNSGQVNSTLQSCLNSSGVPNTTGFVESTFRFSNISAYSDQSLLPCNPRPFPNPDASCTSANGIFVANSTYEHDGIAPNPSCNFFTQICFQPSLGASTLPLPGQYLDTTESDFLNGIRNLSIGSQFAIQLQTNRNYTTRVEFTTSGLSGENLDTILAGNSPLRIQGQIGSNRNPVQTNLTPALTIFATDTTTLASIFYEMRDPDENICPTSPILIDTSGNGFQLTDINTGVLFDFFGGGSPLRTSWTSSASDNAFLVLDRNGNGTIDNGAELFGNLTPQPSVPNPNGFLALAVYDLPEYGGNTDGVVNEQDSIFPSLRLWIDANHNGRSESNEFIYLT
ncbi:hypothetical protein [Anthocerotibacter panamensis]|uniref:hypothetical protein n=1 Tax=Anthocerotibacter panamensis TaxID=2857077 RepID=UPI001C403FA8|nr:hypothetical protein [Anthocerotibacter panamensis]